VLQLSVNSERREGSGFGPARRGRLRNHALKSQEACPTLVDLRRGETAVVERIDLPGDDARRLMELGFLPGTEVTAGQRAPGGDPRVFQVDGSEVALRRETAARVHVRFVGL
jgi:ferrous iron transport protein A